MPSTKENLSNLFRYWVNLYDDKRFPDFEAVYQFVFEEDRETYYFYFSASEGKVEYGVEKHTFIQGRIRGWQDSNS